MKIKFGNIGKLQGFVNVTVLVTALLAAGCATTPRVPPTTRSQQSAITPAQALEKLADGNARFVAGRMERRDWPQLRAATAAGQRTVNSNSAIGSTGTASATTISTNSTKLTTCTTTRSTWTGSTTTAATACSANRTP